jgi:hypothetical protein
VARARQRAPPRGALLEAGHPRVLREPVPRERERSAGSGSPRATSSTRSRRSSTRSSAHSSRAW